MNVAPVPLAPVPLDELAACINEEHRGVLTSVRHGLGRTMAAGDLLIEATELVKHGAGPNGAAGLPSRPSNPRRMLHREPLVRHEGAHEALAAAPGH
jgi:hypothetical protein